MNYETIPPATIEQLRARTNNCFEHKTVPYGYQRISIMGSVAVNGCIEGGMDSERMVQVSEPRYQPFYGRSPQYEAALARQPELAGRDAILHAGVRMVCSYAPLSRAWHDTIGTPAARPSDTTPRTYIRHAGIITPDDVAYVYVHSNQLMPLAGEFSKLHLDALQALPTYERVGDPGRQNANLLMMWREADNLYRDHQDEFQLSIHPHSGVWEPSAAPQHPAS